jgi:nitrogen-specific signal transduction histidine kinase
MRGFCGLSESMDKDPPGRGKKKGSRRQENERFRSNLLSVVSHELNTPLTGIINAITMLEEKFPGEKEYIPMLRRNSERLRRSIENLLEISRVDAGTLRVRLSELDLENFLLSRREALKGHVEAQGFSMELELEEHLPHVCGDIRRLSHVFDSLVLNAVKFSQGSRPGPSGKGVVHVGLTMEPVSSLPPGLLSSRERKTGMYLLVSVQSSLPSIGESPESFEQLFEPFSPWRDADTRVKEGLGVELAIAKEILLAHEGVIWADLAEEGERRRGWKFLFALPLLARVDELDLVVNNRLFTAIGALSKMSLLLLRPEPGFEIREGDEQKISRALQKVLFRSSDSTFWLEDSGEYVILMDDCDHEGGERVAHRILATLKTEMPKMRFLWSLITGPDEGSNARELLEKGRDRWRPSI